MGLDSIQGDIRFVEAARRWARSVTGSANCLQIRPRRLALKAIDLDCNHIPDAAMTLAVMALYADGTTTLRNIESWRVKETDRIAAMACELRKLGASVEEGGLHPASRRWPRPLARLDPHLRRPPGRDVLLARRLQPGAAAGAHPDPKCVAKTFPDYFEALFSVVRRPATRPGDLRRRPHRIRQGHARQPGATPGLPAAGFGRAYRVTALAAAGRPRARCRTRGARRDRRRLPVSFEDERVLLSGQDVTDAIRSETGGMNASEVAARCPPCAGPGRAAARLRRLPGLVADGRDMGTVIFPGAPPQGLPHGGAEQRARRRHKQLISKA